MGSRQPLWHELRAAFADAKVGVAGLGGLGSHVALSLARAGVGHLTLVDFDRVDESNLGRQQYFTNDIGRLKTEALTRHVLAAAPSVSVEVHSVRVADGNVEELFGDCAVVVEAFDRTEAKAMIIRAFGRPALRRVQLVIGSGVAGIASANEIVTRRLTRNIVSCGDGVSDVGPGVSLLAPRVMVAAGHQASVVLRIIAYQAGLLSTCE